MRFWCQLSHFLIYWDTSLWRSCLWSCSLTVLPPMSYVPPPLSFQTPCSACAHVFAHRSQEAHANPLDLLLGCHEKVLDPVLTIHHSSPRPQICSAEQKAYVSCHIQNGIANNEMRSPEMAILPMLSSLKENIHNADEIPLRSFFSFSF